MRRLSILVMAILLAGPAVVAIWQWQWDRLERSQDETIRRAAARYQVDPALVKAIVWRESRFDPAARGLAGELGLMQLREVAAREWADAERISHFQHWDCLDPLTNTLAGSYYLSRLLRRYQDTDDPVPYALADYNAGRSRVLRWLSGSASTNSAEFIRQIGYPATQEYVVEVIRRMDRYAAMRETGS